MGTGSGGPEIRGSNGFGTKCVAADFTGYLSNQFSGCVSFYFLRLLFLPFSQTVWLLPLVLVDRNKPGLMLETFLVH